MNDWMNEWLNEWMNEWMNEWLNEWMNDWMNEWMNEWMNDWMNEWMSSLTQTCPKYRILCWHLCSSLFLAGRRPLWIIRIIVLEADVSRILNTVLASLLVTISCRGGAGTHSATEVGWDVERGWSYYFLWRRGGQDEEVGGRWEEGGEKRDWTKI